MAKGDQSPVFKCRITTSEFRHKATGNIYVLLSDAIDCTNARDGTPVVVYALKGEMSRTFVRDAHEFYRNFEPNWASFEQKEKKKNEIA